MPLLSPFTIFTQKFFVMKTAIHIGSMRFYAYHGVLPQEQKAGNYFRVEVTLYTDFSRALTSDSLDDTVNYVDIYQVIADEMAHPSQLLEHVAGRIITALTHQFPSITGGKIIVTKEKPPITGDIRDVSVVVEW